MHANQLVLLAAEVADRFGESSLSLDWPAFDLETYWTVSQRRRTRWEEVLAPIESLDFSEPDHERLLKAARFVIEEVLVSEILSRIWTAAYDVTDYPGSSRASVSAVRSIWLGHQEVRYRVLRILHQSVNAGVSTALVLNRLRRKTERWSDVILAHLGADPRFIRYAVDRERLADFQFAQDPGEEASSGNWPLFLASLTKAFPAEGSEAANARFNAEIHRTISGILPNVRSTLEIDHPRPLFTDRVWQRLENTSRQMDDWLESYLS